MEWLALGLSLLLLVWWASSRGKKPKVETLQEAKRHHVWEEAKVDADNLGVPPDLLRDLGALVYFGAMRQVVRDKKQATLPTIWSAQNNKAGADQMAGIVAFFGERLCRKIGELPEAKENAANVKILTGEVVGWTGSQIGVDMRQEIVESLRGAK